MKKIFISLSALLFTLFMCIGCTPTPQTALTLDYPWLRTINSEKCVYKVTYYDVIDDVTNEKVALTTDDSALIYTLTSNKTEKEDPVFELKAEFTITYKDNLRKGLETYEGKTDKITTIAQFRKDTFDPVYTYKHAELETNDGAYSYHFEIDYEKSTAKFELDNGEKKVDLSDQLKKGSFTKDPYYDSEYLYYLVRAMSNMDKCSTDGFSESFDVINWYNCFLDGKITTTPLTASYVNVESLASENDAFWDKIEKAGRSGGPTEDQTEEQPKTIRCNKINISLGKGPYIVLHYTTNPYVDVVGQDQKASNRILTKIRLDELTKKGALDCYTEYVLTDFIREM